MRARNNRRRARMILYLEHAHYPFQCKIDYEQVAHEFYLGNYHEEDIQSYHTVNNAEEVSEEYHTFDKQITSRDESE